MQLQLFLLLFLLFSWGCQQASFSPPEVAATDLVQIPEGFPYLAVSETNPLSKAGIALGKQLFFDPILSADSTISCASCHKPELAFADHQPLAIGINRQEGSRNAPSLINIAFYHTGLFWDGRVSTLEEQALIPVEDPLEMGAKWENVEQAIREQSDYVDLFILAFDMDGKEEIDRFLIAKALAQYQRTLTSGPSRYDLAEAGKIQLTDSEERGRIIFMDASADLPDGECGHCHTPPLFTDLTFMNNGLDEVNKLEEYPDKGRGAVTKTKYDNGRFRVPSLRNIAITAPYMHDGRFASLEEVVEHYNKGGHFAPNVDPKVRKLHLSDQNQRDLVDFLRTLTDTSFVNE